MAKPFKIFLAIVGVLLVLVVGGAIAAVALFDANKLKAEIQTAAKDGTGRDLTIAGDLELSLFPWLGVSLSDTTLANAQGFGPEPFAHLKAMDVRVRLLPLLTERRVEIGKVTVHGLALNLTRKEDGATNWDDLVKAGEAEGEQPAKPEGPSPGEQAPIALAVGGLDIRDVALSFVDRQANKSYKLEKLNLETGEVTLEDPIDVTLSFLATASEPDVQADVKLSLTAAHDADFEVVEARGLTLTVLAAGKAVPDGKQEVKLAGDARFDKKAGVAEISGFNAEAMGARLSSKVRYDLNSGVADLTGLVAEAKGARISSNIRFDQQADTVALTDTVVDAHGVKINAAIQGSAVTSEAPKLSGKFSSNTFNPREVAKKFDVELPPMADATAMTAMGFSSDYSGDFKTARLDNLKLKLDQSTATGFVHVTDIEKQAVQFALKMDKIDADRYLAPPPPEDAKKESGSEDFRKTELPLGALDQVNAKGKVEIGELTLKKTKLTDVVLSLDAPKGQVKTQTLNARLYGGTLSQNAKITPGDKPTYTMTMGLNQIETGPVLQALTGKKYLTGFGDLQLNVASGGTTVGDALKGLNGSLSTSLVKGALEGFNLKHKVDQARALYAKETVPPDASVAKRTEFSDLKGAGEIKDGVLTTKSLNASGADYKLNGDGKVDLAGLSIDYVLSPTYTGAANLKGLGGLTIPVRVKGDLFKPEVKVDLAGALKGKAAEAIQEVKETYKEEIKEQREKVKEKAIQKLGDFLAPKEKKKKEQPAGDAGAAPAEKPAETPAEAPAEEAPAQ